MTGPVKYDGRRGRALEAELLRRAEAVLSGDGRNPPVGTIARALFGAAARIGEEVTRRLDQAPAKQADNFYTAAGIGRDPARPAVMPVAFKLVDTADKVVSAAAGTQLMAALEAPVIFETKDRIDLVPGRVSALRGLDAGLDSIAKPALSVIAGALPRSETIARRLRSGAAAGALQIQIDPAAGLEPEMTVSIGEGDSAGEYRIVAVEGDLVTIDPPLETGLAENAPVAEVGLFAPFAATTRNHQSHALYLGHSTLLDIASEATITVSGTALPADAQWSWWGKLGEDDPPDWQLLGQTPSFTKKPGKLVKKKIGGKESLWLRARLPGKSSASASARDVRIAIGGGACDSPRETRCVDNLDEMKVAFEAISNSVPVVPNGAFHPFGLEPRLYDNFYIGSSEALSKSGARISLCFNFAGADLGPLAGISSSGATRFFGVGVDRRLYRLTLPPAASTSLGGSGADLRPLPSPSNGSEIVPLQSQSPVAYWVDGTLHRVAVAAAGAIHVADFNSAGNSDSPIWTMLPLPGAERVTAIAVTTSAGSPILHALQDGNLLSWTAIAPGANPTQRPNVYHLLHVGDADMALIVADNGGLAEVAVQSAGTSQFVTLANIQFGDLPASQLSAVIETTNPVRVHIAGYDEEPPNRSARLRLVAVDVDGATEPALSSPLPLLKRALPIAMSFRAAGLPPTLSIAETRPIHINFYMDGGGNLDFSTATEPVSIGASTNAWRGFARSDDYIVVQRADFGALFRANLTGTAGGGVVKYIRTDAVPGVIVDGAAVAQAHLLTIAAFDGGRPDELFEVFGFPDPDGNRLLRVVQPIAANAPSIGQDLVLYDWGPLTGAVKPASLDVELDHTIGVADLTAIVNDGTASTLWKFATRSSTGDEIWQDPGFATPPLPGWTYQERVAAATVQPALLEPVIAAEAPVVSAFSDGLNLWPADDQTAGPLQLHSFGGQMVVSYPGDRIVAGRASFLAAPPLWESAGASPATNPDLSWQYWNGESWWALATKQVGEPLIDDTANFQRSGGVFFTVPGDIQPTEVAGRSNHYVRVQLTGGDYGEAETREVTQGVFKRDTSTIRAPHITSLRLGYCAREPVAPEVVLTEDSLGTIDQTSANLAGLEFAVFTPIAEAMNPPSLAEAAATTALEAESCDDPCPDEEAVEPTPCDAPGAFESCDSPCIAPEGYRRSGTSVSPGFTRGLMVGFDKKFSADTVSIYVDAEPSGTPSELVAEILHAGRFVPINVVSDFSYGLTEPGILTLAMANPPDSSALFGTSARWLRLRPKSDASSWSPRIRGLHLNAAMALSVESRSNERLGASTGEEDQDFRLAEAPVMAGSLELRVREPLSEEEKQSPTLNVASLENGPPGDWVLWAATDDLSEEAEPARAFEFDPEQGLIRFGNGRNGRIPPLGADVMAFGYARVVGERANGVASGAQPSLLAPLAGVERTVALDHAAGGSDSEPLASARRRAPAKVRHGGRILTLADLEEHASTLSPDIAQVRAEARSGGIRLTVVMKGPEPRPLPAQLRQFKAAIQSASGFGLSRPGGLSLVGPRLLPLAVDVTLVPRWPETFAEAAVQAAALLPAWFDPATGGREKRGWPLGALPSRQDIAAALAPIAPLAFPLDVKIARADRETARARVLPEAVPPDVLVRIDPAAIAFERAEDAA